MRGRCVYPGLGRIDLREYEVALSRMAFSGLVRNSLALNARRQHKIGGISKEPTRKVHAQYKERPGGTRLQASETRTEINARCRSQPNAFV
jgi:hypothetical protein